jgi:sodium-dependent dicarboxylate transporter 2/3/5
MGGFFLAKSLQITNLHKRVALKVLSLIGGSYHGILLAFMLTSFFLSMWISNTATVLLMLSVASGVLLFFEERDYDGSSFKSFAAALCLGIAYSSSIGGTATLIGTPPNGLLSSYLKKQYDIELSMFQWIKDIFPFSILLFGVLWVWFVYVVFRFPKQKIEVKDYLKKEESKLGVYSYDEKVFVL